MQFLNMSEHVQTCLNLFRFNMIWIVTIHVILKHVWTCWNISEHVETCLNLFRFNTIWIVTIHVILKHVWTCWNMSKLVQIQYDMNHYYSCDSQVGNICLLSPLVLSKWEDLAFSVCIKVCLFFNFWMLKCKIMANKTQVWILSLKNWKKHNFLKKYKN